MRDRRFAYDDPIFDDFVVIGGSDWGSCIVVVLDQHDPTKLVFAAKITEVKDLTHEQHEKFEKTFTYFHSDHGRMHGAVNRNSAMVGGKMGAMGWRATQGEKGYKFGCYAAGTYGRSHPEDWLSHTYEEEDVRDLYYESFQGLAPKLLQEQAEHRAQLGVPAFGYFDYNSHTARVFDMRQYFSNLAYTFGN